MPSLDQTVYESERFQTLYGKALRPGGLALTRLALQAARLAKGSRVLDLGCGLGETLEELAAQGYEAVGLDASPLLLQQAQNRHPALGLHLGQAEALPFAPACFDAAVCECCCTLFSQPEMALAELHRVLRPGGRLLLSDFYRINPGSEDPGPRPFPLPTRNTKEWDSLLESAGFSLLHWQDASGYLRGFTARLLWEYGAAAQPFQGWLPVHGQGGKAAPPRRLGYAFSVWQRL